MCLMSQTKKLVIIMLFACISFSYSQQDHEIVVAFDELPCYTLEESYIINISDRDNIDNSEDINTFIAYPNPTNDVLTIESIYVEANVILIDNLGRIILKETLTDNQLTLDLSEYSTGMYHLYIHNGNDAQLINIIKK